MTGDRCTTCLYSVTYRKGGLPDAAVCSHPRVLGRWGRDTGMLPPRVLSCRDAWRRCRGAFHQERKGAVPA